MREKALRLAVMGLLITALTTGSIGTGFAVDAGRITVRVADFPVTFNGVLVKSEQRTYPLLVFRDVTYFPLTWRFAVDEFHWDYHFSQTAGLTIDTRGKICSTEKRILIPTGRPMGSAVALSSGYLYYFSSDEGPGLYRTSLNNPGPAERVPGDLPINDGTYGNYGFGNTWLYDFTDSTALEYHVGGATMGSNYLFKLGKDGTCELLENRILDVQSEPYGEDREIVMRRPIGYIGGADRVAMRNRMTGEVADFGSEWGICGGQFALIEDTVYQAAYVPGLESGPEQAIQSANLKDGTISVLYAGDVGELLGQRDGRLYFTTKDQNDTGEIDIRSLKPGETNPVTVVTGVHLNGSQLSGNHLLYQKDGGLYVYDLDSGDPVTLVLPSQDGWISSSIIKNGRIAVENRQRTDAGLRILDLKGNELFYTTDRPAETEGALFFDGTQAVYETVSRELALVTIEDR